MRTFTLAAVLCFAGGAFAQAKSKDTAAAAKAALDKGDELWNAHDAKALGSMIDNSFFGGGPFVSAKYADAASFRTYLEKTLAEGGHMTREGLTIKPDEDGNAAWFIADYMFVPKVPPGALPVHRKIRVSGALIRHGKEWKFAMFHASYVQPDPATAAPASAPTK
jgi:hypothetical protein